MMRGSLCIHDNTPLTNHYAKMSFPTELQPLSGLTALIVAITTFSVVVTLINNCLVDIRQPIQPKQITNPLDGLTAYDV
ncbi:hypothetical protein QBC35DRAFT_535142, partial [Podospora australis]